MKHILKIFIILLIPTIAFSSSQSKMKDLMPVYRFYKDKKKANQYLLINKIDGSNWVEKGIEFYAYKNDPSKDGVIPIYQFYNSDKKAHMLTPNSDKKVGKSWQQSDLLW